MSTTSRRALGRGGRRAADGHGGPVIPTSAPGKAARAYVAWVLRNGRILRVIAEPARDPGHVADRDAVRASSRRPRGAPPAGVTSVVAIDELRARMPGLKFLGVVVNMADPNNADASERFLDNLATRIRQYPPSLVRAVYTGSAEERAFSRRMPPCTWASTT